MLLENGSSVVLAGTSSRLHGWQGWGQCKTLGQDSATKVNSGDNIPGRSKG
ncbi:hypothetical protein MOQ37_02635 [Escherichia coli]|nr:hypothetical protein [Escherichia coli]